MTLRIRQIVLAARDLESTVADCCAVLGIQVCFHDPGVGEFGLHNALMVIGDQFLEVVSPTRDNTAAGRHIEKHGDSGYMLILQSDDLQRDRERLKRLGVRIVWESNYPDIRSVHLHPKDIGAAIVSIDEAIPAESWRWAGPEWQKFSTGIGATRVVGATIEAVDAAAMAARWAQVLGTDAPRSAPTGLQIDIDHAALHFVSSARKADVLAGFTVTVSDVGVALQAARARGLTVSGSTVTLGGARFTLQ